MVGTVTQKTTDSKDPDFIRAVEKWENCKPPYTGAHMKICVTTAKLILSVQGLPRRSKYQKESYLRFDFSKPGKVSIYAEFPKKMGIKGQRLGERPELSIQIAKEKAAELAEGRLKAESARQVVELYEADLKAKVDRKKLVENNYRAYLCRTANVKEAFTDREIFSAITYNRLVRVLDKWIATKANSHALELFGELRRVWKFGALLFCNGRNVAASLPDDYFSSRVQKPAPTRLFTDIESTAQLWINIASARSVHQKNAVRYMIITGFRPVNISNLRWDYVADDLSVIMYPGGLPSMRGAMKTQKEFRLPVTPQLRIILKSRSTGATKLQTATASTFSCSLATPPSLSLNAHSIN